MLLVMYLTYKPLCVQMKDRLLIVVLCMWLDKHHVLIKELILIVLTLILTINLSVKNVTQASFLKSLQDDVLNVRFDLQNVLNVMSLHVQFVT